MTDIESYNAEQESPYKEVCEVLKEEITKGLPSTEAKVWHGGPVWFDNGNPIVGYWVRNNKQGNRVQLMFWSGLDFKEPTLTQVGKYPTAAIEYKTVNDINTDDLMRWFQKAKVIQWDYKNIVKRKGELIKLGEW